MKVEYMTIDGKVDKEKFKEEWWNSESHDATFLQTENCVYLMPYGKYSILSPGQEKVRFAGTHRRHIFVQRDFEIKDTIVGGGYLSLNEDKKSCKYTDFSVDFGAVPDTELVVSVVTEALLK